MSAPLSDYRPVPVQDAFKSVQSSIKFAASVVAMLVGFGVLAATQGDALVALLGLVPGAVTAVGDVVKSFHVKKAIAAAENKVTPVESPALVIDGVLVPLTPAEPGDHAA